MGRRKEREIGALAAVGEIPVTRSIRWPLLLAAETLALLAAASSVNISPLVAQLFRALLTF
jgi:hypothetical protein